MTLRLLALSILAIIFIPQPLVVIALVALLNYLVIFQLLGLYSAFDYQPLTLLFPMKKGSKNDSAGHGDDNGDRRGDWSGLYFR